MPIEIIDTATPFLEHIAKEAPGMMNKAIKSAGWWMREEIKQGIVAGAPGGRAYTAFSSITTERKLDAYRNRGRTKKGRYRAPRKLKPRKNPMGRLLQATRYKHYPDSMRVVIGWVSPSAEKMGLLHEKGGLIEVTPKMRRFYWAAGIPLTKDRLAIPARPTIEPEYRENQGKIGEYVENKVIGYIEKADVGW